MGFSRLAAVHRGDTEVAEVGSDFLFLRPLAGTRKAAARALFAAAMGLTLGKIDAVHAVIIPWIVLDRPAAQIPMFLVTRPLRLNLSGGRIMVVVPARPKRPGGLSQSAGQSFARLRNCGCGDHRAHRRLRRGLRTRGTNPHRILGDGELNARLPAEMTESLPKRNPFQVESQLVAWFEVRWQLDHKGNLHGILRGRQRLHLKVVERIHEIDVLKPHLRQDLGFELPLERVLESSWLLGQRRTAREQAARHKPEQDAESLRSQRFHLEKAGSAGNLHGVQGAVK